MKKEFIPYEQALALKELGFDEPCVAFYYGQLNRLEIGFNWTNEGCKNSLLEEIVSAPLYQQAFRWFREKYHIMGEVKFKGGRTAKTAWYDYLITSEIDWDVKNPNEQWKKHEEAQLACLKKLIELCKNN